MSKKVLASLTLALSLALAYQTSAQEYDGMAGDAPMAPRASGLRFEGGYQQFRTGNFEGGGASAAAPCNSCGNGCNGNGCNGCGGGLGCNDWKVLPWYAGWDHHHGKNRGDGYGVRTTRHCWSGFGY